MPQGDKPLHHTITVEESFKELNSSPAGLTQKQAEIRLEQNGENKLDEGKKKTIVGIFLTQFKNIMIWVLMVAVLISALMGEGLDAIVIGIVIILNAILGTVQEFRAEQALEALNSMAAPTARVIRDGNTTKIPASQLVVGDIVHIEAGDSVPADLRLYESASLMAEESALTGESLPVDKDPNAICESDALPGDRINMAFMGSSISYGRGMGVVSGTGMNTEMGKIANRLAEPDDETTPLQKKLNEISRTISIGVLIIALVIFTVGILSGRETFEMFLTAVSLAVAAIPEGLVAVVTIVLALGMQKMAGRGAIIRKLPAVETLGCTQVICSDKTGTLTLNRMTVQKTYTKDNEDMIAECMVTCNDSQPDKDGKMVGDPTETAMIDYALKGSYTHQDIITRTRDGEIPFDSDRKLMTVIKNGRAWIKGAPDVLIDRCTNIQVGDNAQHISQADKDEINNKNSNMAKDALRVIAFAYRNGDDFDTENPSAVENDLTFIGLCGMIDPPRDEARKAVAECRDAGITPVMITGDHAITAGAIAKDLGILQPGQEVITGKQLQEMNDDQLRMHYENTSVYARVAPEHKVRIVNIWQESGAVVAMTGDGVNDAPALKEADIGVGMGITGTDVSKAASDMVLTDDNFATIVHAVEEGRKVYQNIRKAVKFLLSSNMGEVIALLTATLLGWTILRPVQILWINLVTDTFPALALGMEPMEADVMKRKPRDAKKPFFDGKTWFTIGLHGAFEAGLALLAFVFGRSWGGETLGMTMAFLTLGLAQLFQSFGIRSERNSVIKIGLLKNKMMLLALAVSTTLQVMVVIIPPLRDIFRLTMPTGSQWITVFSLAFCMLIITELHKLILKLFDKE